MQHALTFQCCFAAKETIRLIRDGEPRTATSTFTQPLSSAKNAHKQTAARSYLSQTRHCSKLCGWAKTVLEMAGIIPANCYDSRSARADCAGDGERTGAAVHTVIKVALHTVIRWFCLLSWWWLCLLSYGGSAYCHQGGSAYCHKAVSYTHLTLPTKVNV